MQEFVQILVNIIFDFIYAQTFLIWPELAAVLLYKAAARKISRSDGDRKELIRKRVLKTGLAGYLFLILWAAVLSREAGSRGRIMLIPFSSWGDSLEYHKHFIENYLMMIPMGILLPALKPDGRSWKKILMICFIISLALETIQLITGTGDFQIDDLFSNALSGLIGYWIWIFFRKDDECYVSDC